MNETSSFTLDVRYGGDLSDPVGVLEGFIVASGRTLVQAAFEHSFFLAPDAVRHRTPYYPDRARLSRTHYPDLKRGQQGFWRGREVRLGDNSRAQMAWARYSRTPLSRGSGYGVRHVWGHPWDPDAFTAGWNLCYMPYWVGMLTEDQHPHPGLTRAIQQASYDLYFRSMPVCVKPEFVTDPGLDLAELLDGRPLRILRGDTGNGDEARARAVVGERMPEDVVRSIRAARHSSWANLLKAVRALQGLPHDAFGTGNVRNASCSIVRKMVKETRLPLADLEEFLERLAGG
jgi:hypothetical protein